MKSFEQLVNEMVVAIRLKGRRCNSWHEGYALILEEVDELWEEVRKKTSKRNLPGSLTELVQISALCQIMAEDLKLTDYSQLVVIKNGTSTEDRQ